MIPSFKNSVCERCLKHVADHSIHTCTPTNGWRKLEQQRDELLLALEHLCNRAEFEFVAESIGWPAYKQARAAIAKVKGGA